VFIFYVASAISLVNKDVDKYHFHFQQCASCTQSVSQFFFLIATLKVATKVQTPVTFGKRL